jgi:hypothetical protein
MANYPIVKIEQRMGICFEPFVKFVQTPKIVTLVSHDDPSLRLENQSQAKLKRSPDMCTLSASQKSHRSRTENGVCGAVASPAVMAITK